MRRALILMSGCALSLMVACGGGGTPTSNAGGNSVTPSTASNVAAVVVDPGPAGNYTNGLFVTVTVCVPGTTTCQSIDHVLVDTGSEGLRVLSSVLTLSLPQQKDATGNAIAQCNVFADGTFTWGPLASADIQIAGEKASAVPIQVIGETQIPVTPTCTGTDNDTVQTLEANGILGIGPFLQDCGQFCVTSIPSPAFYYSCSSSGCTPTVEALASQLQNPVGMFSTDNNGTIIELPGISNNGAATVTGSLVFGIGTQSNNGLQGATALAIDPSSGTIATQFNGLQYSGTVIDSGSNGLFILDAGTLGVTTCPSPDDSFYCPGAPNTNALNSRNLSAINFDSASDSSTVNFSIANAEFLFGANGGTNFAFNNLGGPNSGAFDWGLPFFFGRNVFTAIENQNTPIGAGPYYAY